MDTVLNPTIFSRIFIRIIKEQENIIGPLAWGEASKVEGVAKVSREYSEVSFVGDPKAAINKLVERYEQLFGKLSREVSREAVMDLMSELSASDIPNSLR
jgi:hypothetical protein